MANTVHFIEDQHMLDKIYRLVRHDGLEYQRQIYNALMMGANTWANLKADPSSQIIKTIERATADREAAIDRLYSSILFDVSHKQHGDFVKEEKKRMRRKEGEPDQKVTIESEEAKGLSDEDLLQGL